MKKALRYLNNLEEYLCNFSLVAMLLLLTYQVILRYVFTKSNAWSEELARYFFIWLIFISTSYAERENAHIRIESLQKVFPKALRQWVALLGQVILLVFCLVMLKISLEYTLKVIQTKQVSLGLKLNMGYVYAAIPTGYFLLCVRIAGNVLMKKHIPAPQAEHAGEDDSDLLPKGGAGL